MPDAVSPSQDRSSSPHINPALQSLAFLVGEWDMELSNAAFLPDQTATVKGALTITWIQDGAFLIMLMGNTATPDARWLISRDGDRPTYTMSYYDTRQVSRIYEMTRNERIWKIWRTHPTFSQRFEGVVSEDARTIVAHWEKSTDGLTWEHDFDVTYTKKSS